MDYEQCHRTIGKLFLTLDNSAWCHTREFLLVVGLLSNVANIVVFRHERMKSYVNSLFYWLAIFNFLTLLPIAVFTLFYGMEHATYITSYFFITMGRDWRTPVEMGPETHSRFYPSFYASYFLLSLHTVTVFLNIAIALCLSTAMKNPQRLKVWCNYSPVRRTVASVFVLGFMLWIPHVFLVPDTSRSRFNDGNGVEIAVPSPSYKWITLLCGGLVCYSLFIAMLIVCISLITNIVKARRERRDPIPELMDSGVVGEGAVDQFTKEITNLTLPVAQIFVFLITELTIAVVPILSFVHSVLPIGDELEEQFALYCFGIIKTLLNGIVVSTILVSSSYITCCYLTSAHYRGTLEMLFRSGYGRLKRILKLGSYREFQTGQQVSTL